MKRPGAGRVHPDRSETGETDSRATYASPTTVRVKHKQLENNLNRLPPHVATRWIRWILLHTRMSMTKIVPQPRRPTRPPVHHRLVYASPASLSVPDHSNSAPCLSPIRSNHDLDTAAGGVCENLFVVFESVAN